MPAVLGQSVLKRKDKLALDAKNRLGHTVRMADSDEKALYGQEFIQRVRSARIAMGLKQWQLADMLGIKQDEYKHYETGRLMPHHLIGRFCLFTRIDPNWLITGRGPKPLQPPHVVEAGPATVPRPKRTRRSRAA